MENKVLKRYTIQELWSLFLMCAFPLHVWTLILAFRDFSWVTERTNAWDAIGVVSYGLIFALIESVVVFFIAFILGFLVSKKWRGNPRITLLQILVVITSLWAMTSYLFFMLQVSIPEAGIIFLVNLRHPLRFLYVVLLSFVGLTVAIPTYLVLQSKKFLHSMQRLFERLSLLTLFYLFFDFVGLIIVIFRNV